MTKTLVRWTGAKTRFEASSGSGHDAFLDEGAPFGDDTAMRPTEMLLTALGGCAGINAVLLLKRFRQPVDSLAVEVEGDQEPDWPKRFTAIRINFVIGWSGPYDRDSVEKALDMACNRYCPVDATLTLGARIQHSFTEATTPA